MNDLIVRKIKDKHDLTQGNPSDVKLKMIEFDRKIGHKSIMSISKSFIDRDKQSHLVDLKIHYMEGIGEESAEGDNGMDPFFTAALSVDGATAI